MKTRIILMIAGAALVTLSFTFVSVENTSDDHIPQTAQPSHSAPVGGLFAEDVLN